MYRFLCEKKFQLIWVSIRSETAESYGRRMFRFFKETAKLPSNVAVPFCVLTTFIFKTYFFGCRILGWQFFVFHGKMLSPTFCAPLFLVGSQQSFILSLLWMMSECFLYLSSSAVWLWCTQMWVSFHLLYLDKCLL